MADSFETQYQFLDPLIDSEDEVLAIRAAALALYKEGKTIIEWEGEGTSAKRAFVAPIEKILAETRMFLKQLNPAVYGYPIRNSRVFRIA
jgi:hypothetical protein